MARALQTTTLNKPIGARTVHIHLDGPSVSPGWLVYIEREAMLVQEILLAAAYVVCKVMRGVDGTSAHAHPAGVTCYVAPKGQFSMVNPAGVATELTVPVLPVVNILTGDVFTATDGAFVQTGWGGVTQAFPVPPEP